MIASAWLGTTPPSPTPLVDAGKTIDDRSRLYEDAQTGLKSRFQKAKAAVASQFGRRSPEYEAISWEHFAPTRVTLDRWLQLAIISTATTRATHSPHGSSANIH